MIAMRTCKKCEVEKELASFVKSRKHYEHTCKTCKNIRQKERLVERGLKDQRGYNLRAKYNLSMKEYDAMLADQGGVCAICKTDSPGGRHNNKYFHIDHDHACCFDKVTCGKCICGLLCANCNTAIGLLGDDPDRVRAAAQYLEATRTQSL